jgi:hypothetical protein
VCVCVEAEVCVCGGLFDGWWKERARSELAVFSPLNLTLFIYLGTDEQVHFRVSFQHHPTHGHSAHKFFVSNS